MLLVGPQRAGDSYGEQIAALSRSTGLGERVRFGGDCDDMPAAMMLADLVVLPATAPEAFGLVVAEAQAMGKPVVVTAMGGLPETLMPGATGWLVRPDDPEELAWALDLALRMEPEVKARLAERAREFVAGELGIERTWQRTAAVYEELRRAHRARLMAEILVIKHGALGDMVLALGAIAAIRAHHPHDRLTLLTTPPYVELVEPSGWLDSIWAERRAPFWRLGEALRLRRGVARSGAGPYL